MGTGAGSSLPLECADVLGRGLHSFPLPLNLSILRPFPLNLSLLCPPYNPINPWMRPEGAQVEL